MNEIEEEKEKRKDLIIYGIVLSLLCIGIAYSIYSSTIEHREVPSSFTLVKSVYQYPSWNITLKQTSNFSVSLSRIKIVCGAQTLIEKKYEINLDVGDTLTLNCFLVVHVAPQENFTLFLFFKDRTYMKINLGSPEEKG